MQYGHNMLAQNAETVWKYALYIKSALCELHRMKIVLLFAARRSYQKT